MRVNKKSKDAYEKAEADLQRALTQAQGSVDVEGIRGIAKFVPILERGVEGVDGPVAEKRRCTGGPPGLSVLPINLVIIQK